VHCFAPRKESGPHVSRARFHLRTTTTVHTVRNKNIREFAFEKAKLLFEDFCRITGLVRCLTAEALSPCVNQVLGIGGTDTINRLVSGVLACVMTDTITSLGFDYNFPFVARPMCSHEAIDMFPYPAHNDVSNGTMFSDQDLTFKQDGRFLAKALFANGYPAIVYNFLPVTLDL
jgi:hypothetical protein